MELRQSIILAAIVTVVAFYLQWRRYWSKNQIRNHLIEMVLVACLTGGAAFGASYAVQTYRINAKVEALFNTIKDKAIIAVILKDHPEDGAQIRDDLRAEFEKSSTDQRGVDPLIKLSEILNKLKQKYLPPALLAADDAAIEAVADQSVRMIAYLEMKDFHLCRIWIESGIVDTKTFDGKGKIIISDYTNALEDAYKSGRDNKNKIRFVLSEAEKIRFWQTVSPSPSELQAMDGKGTDEDACSVGFKMFFTINKLDEAHKSLVSRWILSGGQ